MPILSSWIYVGVLAAFIGVGLGSYFYGHHQGANSVKAQLADSYSDALRQFSDDAVKAAAAATAKALADFTAKTAILDQLADQFRKAQGVMNAASSKLAASLRDGPCVLSPMQRQLLECVRRPSGAGCSIPAVPAT